MARTKSWFNTGGFGQNGIPATPYVAVVDEFTAGTTLLRTKLFFEINVYSQWAGDLASYPTPWAGWQTAIALCWSSAGPPDGYFIEPDLDWIFFTQVSFDVYPFLTPNSLTIGDVSYNTYCRNTLESRVIDSQSERLATEDTALYVVMDSAEFGSTDSSQWLPNYGWLSRTLQLSP